MVAVTAGEVLADQKTRPARRGDVRYRQNIQVAQKTKISANICKYKFKLKYKYKIQLEQGRTVYM